MTVDPGRFLGSSGVVKIEIESLDADEHAVV